MPTSNPLNPKTASDWVLTVLVAIAVLIVLYMAAGYLTGDDGPDGDEAKAACRVLVEDRLVAPATADFSGLSAAGGGDRWTVKGSVDAENRLGTPIRMNFTCVVEYSGGDWLLIRMSGLNG